MILAEDIVSGNRSCGQKTSPRTEGSSAETENRSREELVSLKREETEEGREV